MSKDDIKAILKIHRYDMVSEERMKNGYGDTLRLSNGCILNLYDTGKIVYQGKNSDHIKAILERVPETTAANRKVFVVYGHDQVARTQLEAMLRRWALEPLIIDQLESSGNTIIEKLEGYIPQADFGIVLATPDDIGYPKGSETSKKYRVRQNVVLEMGMLLASMGRSKVAILLKNTEDMEKPSDIHGLIYIPFTSDVKEVTVDLAKEMNKNGYYIDISKL
ncbi:MAG: nucleotide-binding protein [Lachnospiraceae bacterium]